MTGDIPDLPADWYISNNPVDYGVMWIREDGGKRRPTDAEAKAIHEVFRRQHDKMQHEMFGEIRWPYRR